MVFKKLFRSELSKLNRELQESISQEEDIKQRIAEYNKIIDEENTFSDNANSSERRLNLSRRRSKRFKEKIKECGKFLQPPTTVPKFSNRMSIIVIIETVLPMIENTRMKKVNQIEDYQNNTKRALRRRISDLFVCGRPPSARQNKTESTVPDVVIQAQYTQQLVNRMNVLGTQLSN